MRTSTLVPCVAPFVILASAFCAAPAQAQSVSPKTILREGDHILTLGNVRNIDTPRITDNGLWFCEVSSDFGNNTEDGGLIRNGFLSLQEMTPLGLPVGANIDEFLDLAVNSQGHLGWPLDMGDTGSNNTDHGLFWNTTLFAQEGSPVNAPEVSANASHKAFRAAKINDANTLLLICDIDDPSITGPTENALIMYRTDGAGNVTSQNVLLKESDQILFGASILNISGNTTHTIALNNNDDWMCQVKLSGPPGGTDTALLINGEIVLREGAASFQDGRTWNDFGNPQLDLNDFGDYVANVNLDLSDGSDNAVIIRNGEKFVQEGDALLSVAPFRITRFGSAPLFIGNSGDVFWYGFTTNPDANANEGYFRNQEVIVIEGQFVTGGIVTSVRPGPNAFHVSPSGRYWIGEVGLQATGQTLLFADFGLVVPIPGCSGNPGSLAKAAGAPVSGGNMTFGMDDGQATGVTPFLYFSTRPAIQGSGCGINTSFGELLIALGGSRVGRLLGTPWNGLSPTLINLNLPPDPNLVDVELFAQGLWWDIAGTSGAERFRLTNGLRLEIGAP